MNKPPSVPRLAALLLRLLIPHRTRQSVSADLEEEYRNEILPKLGRRKARLWFWREAGSLAKWYALYRIRHGSNRRVNNRPLTLERRQNQSFYRIRDGVESSIQDFRFGLRTLGKRPFFSSIVVLVLSLGIGANVAIFSMVHAVLIEPLPYPEANRLVGVWHTGPGRGIDRARHPEITYTFYRQENRAFEEMGIYRPAGFNLTGGESPERLGGLFVTPSVFDLLRVSPLLGRSFLEADGYPDSPNTVIMSHTLWIRRYGADPDIVGTTVHIDGVPRTVVGVMPSGFAFPDRDARLWLPMQIDPSSPDRSYWQNTGIARLRSGVSRAQAEAEMNQVVARLPYVYRDPEQAISVFNDMRLGIELSSFKDDLVVSVSGTLWILLGSVGILMMIACANVANLFLVRAEGRRHEMAVRTALGAGRGALARVVFSESVFLALAGGVGGVLLAYLASPAILAAAPQNLPRMENLGINGSVVVFAIVVTLLSCLLFGLAPVFQRMPEPAEALHHAGRRATAGRRRAWIRSSLAVAQVTLALVLMTGSGLLVRSFLNLQGVDGGFDPERVLTLRLPLTSSDYPSQTEVIAFYDDVLNRIRALPGVASAGAGSGLPYAGRGTMLGHTMEDFPVAEEEFVPNYSTQHIVPGFFESLGIPLLAGRMFNQTDVTEDTRAVIVSASLAERYWPGLDAIGRMLTPARPEDGNDWYEIVGIVGGVRYEDVSEPPTEVIYYPLKPLHFAADADPIFPIGLGLIIKTAVPPATVSRAVNEAVWAVDPDLPVTAVRTMREIADDATAQAAFSMLLLLLAAMMALVLGIVGLYGVLSYLVGQRTEEIGVRMALGANRWNVLSMILRSGVVLALTGIVLGVVGSLALTRTLRAFLFDVSPSDPTILGTVSLLLLSVSVLATLLPASRAASVGPLTAIRHE